MLQLHLPLRVVPRPVAGAWRWGYVCLYSGHLRDDGEVGSFLMQALGDECLGGHHCVFLVNADCPWSCVHVLTLEKGPVKRREHGVW